MKIFGILEISLSIAPVAQPVEHVLGKDGVTGSIPVGGFEKVK